MLTISHSIERTYFLCLKIAWQNHFRFSRALQIIPHHLGPIIPLYLINIPSSSAVCSPRKLFVKYTCRTGHKLGTKVQPGNSCNPAEHIPWNSRFPVATALPFHGNVFFAGSHIPHLSWISGSFSPWMRLTARERGEVEYNLSVLPHPVSLLSAPLAFVSRTYDVSFAHRLSSFLSWRSPSAHHFTHPYPTVYIMHGGILKTRPCTIWEVEIGPPLNIPW